MLLAKFAKLNTSLPSSKPTIMVRTITLTPSHMISLLLNGAYLLILSIQLKKPKSIQPLVEWMFLNPSIT